VTRLVNLSAWRIEILLAARRFVFVNHILYPSHLLFNFAPPEGTYRRYLHRANRNRFDSMHPQMLEGNSRDKPRTGVEYLTSMHLIEFRQIVRDAEIANAISSVVRTHRLREKDTEKALLKLSIPRAANVARISVALSL
jgi:hypothetical protein